MNYKNLSHQQLIEKLTEIEMLNKELLAEKDQETSLNFAWSGNLGHWYLNLTTEAVVFNPLKITALGYTMEELPEKVTYSFFTDKLHPDDVKNTMNAMLLHIQGKVSAYEAEYRIQTKEKCWKWFYDRGKITQRDLDGSPTLISGIVFDITERKEQELALKKENDTRYIDKLTGYSNEAIFQQKAENLIHDLRVRYAFIELDINKFTVVNEIFGYEYGNLLLKHIAKVLNSHLMNDEIFARITGDKFHIILKFTNMQSLEKRIAEVIEDIKLFNYENELHLNLVVCAGIYIINDTDKQLGVIRDKANLAANTIKGSYTSQYVFYNDDIRKKIINESEIENEMHEALRNGDFKVYLQPKYTIKTGRLSGAEALVRWIHPQKGIIMPDRFIPIFEKNGFVTKIDMFVFEEVCKMQEDIQTYGMHPLCISVNQSRVNLNNPLYVDTLKSIFDHYPIDPELLELELTESAFSCSMDTIFDTTRRLHSIGFRLAIDDFGTGYSALTMLKDIFVDVVKLDREFLQTNIDGLRGRTIIRSIIKMAKDLEIETVAEGVETKAQIEFLDEIGCDIGQGYYYSKPMPMSDFYELLKKAF